MERDNVPFEMWPSFLRKKPELSLGLELYYTAFNELNTCRSVGMSLGPIPFTAMVDYARAFDLSDRQTEDLIYFVRQMDQAYLQFVERKSKSKGKSLGRS